MVCEILVIFFEFNSSITVHGINLKQHKTMQLQQLPREALKLSILLGLMDYKIRMENNACFICNFAATLENITCVHHVYLPIRRLKWYRTEHSF